MAVSTFELEIPSSLSASTLFKAYNDFDNLAPKVEPETFKSFAILEGDGGAGTIKEGYFSDGLPFTYGKSKVDVVDSANHCISLTVFEGDVLMGILDSVTHQMKFVPSADGGCVYKHTGVYNCKGDTPLADEFLNMAKEALTKTFKLVEAHIHANPKAY